eukprot:585983-Ditylum_brightwellii.AAC.1
MDPAERPENSSIVEEFSDKLHMEDSKQNDPKEIMHSTRAMEAETYPVADPNPDVQVTGIDWSNTLGGCTNKILQKTLENTTQYYPDHVAAKTRLYPKQH